MHSKIYSRMCWWLLPLYAIFGRQCKARTTLRGGLYIDATLQVLDVQEALGVSTYQATHIKQHT
jgi:hypothetical protein